MKKRSPEYPSYSISQCLELALLVFSKSGDSIPLEYSDISKHAEIPSRDASYFASTARQYGFFVYERKKGLKPVAAVLNALRVPYDDSEKNKFLIQAFCSPELYKSLIREFNNKQLPIAESLATHLIRSYEFTDKGATDASENFWKNVTELGIISPENILTVSEDAINFRPTEKTTERKKTVTIKIRPKKNESHEVPQEKSVNPSIQVSLLNTTVKIPVYLRGSKFYVEVPRDIKKTEWEELAEQFLSRAQTL